MVLGQQTIGSIAQVLAATRLDAVDVLFYKHLGFTTSYCGSGMSGFLEALQNADDDAIRPLVGEMVREPDTLRVYASPKYAFDGAWRELQHWLLHDGWTVDGGALVRLAPAAEEGTGVRDRLLEELQSSGLDPDAAIATCLEDAATDFKAEPPDYNGSITKVRIALETTARRSATQLAAAHKGTYHPDTWGKALEFLRTIRVLELQEEEILARVYTFISPGAHLPVGVTHEEWARLARTFGIGTCYFVLKKHMAAT